MVNKLLGTVISDVDGPNTSQFSFVITNLETRKGQFVKVAIKDGTLVGLITEIFSRNKYYEKAESVSGYGGQIKDNFPIKEWECLVAEVNVLGLYDEGVMDRVIFPPSPGVDVYVADDVLLNNFLGFKQDGLDIGHLNNHPNVRVKMNMSKLLQKHLAILAISGAGKSYLTSVILEELLLRPKNKSIGVVIIDIHGEYLGFGDSVYKERVKVYGKDDLKIGLKNLSSKIISSWFDMSRAQSRCLDKLLSKMKKDMAEEKQLFNLKDLIGLVEKSDIKANVKPVLLSSLIELNELNVISRFDSPNINSLVRPGELSIINLKDIDSMKKKQILVSYFGRKLFNHRKSRRIPPFLLLVEEAHNFAREGAKRKVVLAKSIIETIAREGRKFGACLCLVSQRPIQLSTTALSQCNTDIIMRITNPYDIDHIKKSAEGMDNSMARTITSLHVGEALIIGEGANYPVFVKVRQLKTALNKDSKSLEEMCQEYVNKKEEEKEKVGAFI